MFMLHSSGFAEVADQVAQGNFKELQKQVILNFRNMGR